MNTIPTSLLRLRIAAGLGLAVGLVAVVLGFAVSWWMGLGLLYVAPLVPSIFVWLAELTSR